MDDIVKSEFIGVRIDKGLRESLDAICIKRKKGLSCIIRKALEDFVNKEKKKNG